MAGESIVKIFFHMSLNIKLYHWQTMSFAQHKATDDLFLALLPLIDQFMEVYIGRYSRPDFEKDANVRISQYDSESFVELLNNYIEFLKTDIERYLSKNDTDLMNIRDEMLGLLNKTLYLFTLN